MPRSSVDALSRLAQGGRIARYLLALATVAAATLARLVVDPLIHDQIPYFVYVAAVVVATRWAGVEGGLLSTVVAAFVGNYLFVSPRYEFWPHGEDWMAMVLFSAVALGLVAVVARWRQQEQETRRLQEQTTAVLEQMPVGVVVTNGAGVIQFRNSTFDRVLGTTSRVGMTLAEFRDGREYTTLRTQGGAEIQTDERPVSRALRGETVHDEEIQVVLPGGSRRTVSASAVPIRQADGRIAGAVGAITETTERKRLEAQLLQREEQLRAATLAAEVGVWTWTPGTSRMSVGANWRQLFGVAAEADVTFETWVGALHPADRDRAVETLNRAWRERQDFSVEYRVVCPDGTVRWLVDRGRASYDAAGAVIGMAGINLDITSIKEAEDALRDANRLKDEFLATLSHELRTPLNAIVGWSDMLRRGSLKPEELSRATESIYRNAKLQSEMISDVLDVSRIISGKVQIQPKPMDLPALLHNAMESVRAAADAKGVVLVGEINAIRFPVSGDPTRIQQVFWNLLSNAVKFSNAGGLVRVSLCLEDGQARVRVSDTGIGISPDFLPHVFERFRQRDSSSTRHHGGLGLGLAIVKHLVELHGGTVEAESPGEGHGATFTVTLPAQPFDDRRREERRVVRKVACVEPGPDDVPSLCGVRVMVVDDERDAREVSASVLHHHGATVAVAASAAQALDQLARFEPDVLLIDLAMPDMDGYELLDRVRASRGGNGDAIPAIAFTAYAREEDQRRTRASGFALHVAKPVDSHTLVRAVASVSRSRP